MNRHYRYYRRRRAEEVKSILFAGMIALVVGVCLSISLTSADPFILGTEMNANGTVEYLCLGSGCESISAPGW